MRPREAGDQRAYASPEGEAAAADVARQHEPASPAREIERRYDAFMSAFVKDTPVGLVTRILAPKTFQGPSGEPNAEQAYPWTALAGKFGGMAATTLPLGAAAAAGRPAAAGLNTLRMGLSRRMAIGAETFGAQMGLEQVAAEREATGGLDPTGLAKAVGGGAAVGAGLGAAGMAPAMTAGRLPDWMTKRVSDALIARVVGGGASAAVGGAAAAAHGGSAEDIGLNAALFGLLGMVHNANIDPVHKAEAFDTVVEPLVKVRVASGIPPKQAVAQSRAELGEFLEQAMPTPPEIQAHKDYPKLKADVANAIRGTNPSIPPEAAEAAAEREIAKAALERRVTVADLNRISAKPEAGKGLPAPETPAATPEAPRALTIQPGEVRPEPALTPAPAPETPAAPAPSQAQPEALPALPEPSPAARRSEAPPPTAPEGPISAAGGAGPVAPEAPAIPESYFPEVSQTGAPIGPAAAAAPVDRMHEAVQGPVRAKLEAVRADLETRPADQKPGALDPEGLAAFLIRKGGISIAKSPENAGELTPFTKKELGIGGLAHTNPKRGLNLSQAVEAAKEAGLIADSTENDLLDALDQELTRSRRDAAPKGPPSLAQRLDAAPKGPPSLAQRLDAQFGIPRRKLARLIREISEGGGTGPEAEQVRAAALEEVGSQAQANIESMVRAAEPGDLAEMPQGQIELWRDLLAEDIKTLHAVSGKEDLPAKAMEKLWELERAAKAAGAGRFQSSFSRGDEGFDMPFGGTFRRPEGGQEFSLPDGYKPLDTALRKPPKVIDKGPKPGPASFKKAIQASTGLAKDEKVLTEKQALKLKLESEARGAREAAQATRSRLLKEFQVEAKWTAAQADLKNEWDLARQAHGYEGKLADSKEKVYQERWLAAEAKADAARVVSMKKMISDYAREVLPIAAQGKFLTAVQAAKTPDDAVKAFQRIDIEAARLYKNELVADIRKVIGRIMDSDAIAVEYKAAVRSLVAGLELQRHRPSTIESLKATRAFLDRMADSGKTVEIPPELADKLRILTRKPLADIPVNVLESVRADLEVLKQLGETKQAAREAIYQAEKDRSRAALIAAVQPIETMRPVEAPLLEDKPLTAKEHLQNAVTQVMNFGQHVDVMLWPSDVLFDVLDGSQGYRGPHSQIIKAPVDAAFGLYLDQKDAWIDPVAKLARDLGMKAFNYNRIGIHAFREQPGGREYLHTLGIKDAEIDGLKLGPKETQLYEAMRKTIEEPYAAVADMLRTVYNKEIGKRPNYFPVQTNFEATADNLTQDRLAETYEPIGKTKTVEQGFTKERKGGPQKIRLNAMGVFARHMDEVAYFLKMGPTVKKIYEVVNHPDYRKAAGDLGHKAVIEWLDLVARKGGTEQGRKLPDLDMLRRNAGASMLAFKTSSALIQVTSLFEAFPLIGPGYVSQGMRRVLFDEDWSRFILKNFPEVRHRVGDDPAFTELSGVAWLSHLQRIGLTPLEVMDRLMAMSATAGAYQRELDLLKRPMDFNVLHKDAAARAMLLARRSQSSPFFKDQPLMVSKGMLTPKTVNQSLAKAGFQYKSFVVNRFSLKHDIWAALTGQDPAQAANIVFWLGIASAAETGLRWGNRAAWAAVLGSLGFAGAKAAKDDWDHIKQDLLKNSLDNVPFLGDLVFGNFGTFPVLGPFVDMSKGISQMRTAKNPTSRAKGGVRAAGGLASVFGIPGTAQVSQIARAALGDAPRGKAK